MSISVLIAAVPLLQEGSQHGMNSLCGDFFPSSLSVPSPNSAHTPALTQGQLPPPGPSQPTRFPWLTAHTLIAGSRPLPTRLRRALACRGSPRCGSGRPADCMAAAETGHP